MADTYNNKQIDMINGCWYYTEDHASVKELNSEIFKEQCRVAAKPIKRSDGYEKKCTY